MATFPVISDRPPTTLAELINPTERQREFLQAIATHDFVLYGGEGSGGKSYILRWWLVSFLIECYEVLGLKNVRVGIFCEDYPALRDRQVIKMRTEFPRWLGRLAKTETWDFTLAPEYGGGQIALRNLDDPSKYASSEFAAVAVDELTKNPLSVFNDLRWRIRWPGIKRRPFGAGANPGEPDSPGRIWVKNYWKDGKFPPEFYADEASGRRDITKEFVLIHAKASDNPYLDTGYWERLLSLPPDMAKRVAHGDWDSFAGQYFPHFDQQIHVLPHKEAMARIKKWYKRSLSGDWGYDHPHCFHWHAKDENDVVITYREQWGRQMHEADVGKLLTEMEAQDIHLQQLNGFAFSWDDGKLSPRSTKESPKSIDRMLREALGPRIPHPHPNDSRPHQRIVRGRLMSQLLAARTWFISDACPKLIEAIPTMMRNPDHTEEMRKIDWDSITVGDDPVDCAAIGLQWMVGNSIKPRDVQLEETLAAVRSKFAGPRSTNVREADLIEKFGARIFA